MPLDILDSSSRGKDKSQIIPFAEICKKFREFAIPFINDGISLFTDGSRRDEDSAVGAAVYSPDLGLAKYKFPETSIFSAEAWAIYQALILIKSSSYSSAAIFSDSRSVLDALVSLAQIWI